MKNVFLHIILTLSYVSTFSQQTKKSIKEIIYRIDYTQFSDSITIIDTTNRMLKPLEITAYLSGDTLLKSITRFKESARIRWTYYDNDRAIYVKDFDSLTNEIYVEVYGSSYSILSANIVKPLRIDVGKEPYQLLEQADYSVTIGFALVDRKADKYHFKVKLVETIPLPPDCGTFAFGHLQKFEVLSTDFPNYGKKYVLIIEPCPEFLGHDFFQSHSIYEVDVATNSGVTFDYGYINNYEKENLPIFWSRNIERKN